MPPSVHNSPLVSDLIQHNEPPRDNRASSPAPTSSSRHLATRDEVERGEVATLSTHLRAASGEIPRAFGVAVFSLVFAYAGQKTVLALMKNHKAKPTLVIAGGVGDASSGVAKEFAKAFLSTYFPTLKVPNNVDKGWWPLTKQAGTTLVLSAVTEALFHFMAGVSNSFGISKEMSYYGVDHIADKSEAYLQILNRINPNEIWSPLGVKAGAEFLKDIITVLVVAFSFKLLHPEHDFQMCRKFNLGKILITGLIHTPGRLIVSACSGAWINSNNNASQAAFMFTGTRNASLPAVFNLLRVALMGIMLAAVTNKFSSADSPIDAENLIGESAGNDEHDLPLWPNRESSRVVEGDDVPEQARGENTVSDTPEQARGENIVSDASEQARGEDVVENVSEQARGENVEKIQDSDNPPPLQPKLTTNVAAISPAEDVTKSVATDTSDGAKGAINS